MYKKLKKITLVLGLIANMFVWSAKLRSAVITFYNQGILRSVSYSVTPTYDLNALGVGQMSTQITVSTVNTSASTFTDGGQSTGSIIVSSWTALIASKAIGTITIASNTALAGATAYNYVSVASNTALDGNFAFNSITVTTMTNATTASFRLNGVTFQSSVAWNLGGSSVATALNIVSLLNNTTIGFNIIASTAGAGNVVNIQLAHVGAAGNVYTLVSSTQAALTVLTTTFTGGADPVSLTLNRTNIVTAGQQFQLSPFSTQTAYNLSQVLDGLDYGIVATTGTNLGPVGFTGSSITVALNVVGSVYNSYALISSSPTALRVSFSSFIGGADPVVVKVNGVQFKNGVDWFTGPASSNSAQSLFFAISSNTGLGSIITSTAAQGTATGIVTLTAISSGSAYVYPLFTSSQTAARLSGVSTTWSGSTVSVITGGRNHAVLGINGVYLTQGTQWFAVLSNTQTAASISDAILASSQLRAFVTSTWTALNLQASVPGMVTSTSIIVGASQNFALFSSTPAALSLSSNSASGIGLTGTATGFMSGGTDVTYSSITDIINLPNNTLGAGTAVLFSTGGASGGIGIQNLVFASTYFVILVDTSNVKLALTSSGAIAGVPIDLASLTTQTIAHTFTLTPIPPLGTSFGNWQVSNDSSTWFDVPGTTVSFVSPYLSSSVFQNQGIQNERYIRFRIVSSTSGAYRWAIVINGKSE